MAKAQERILAKELYLKFKKQKEIARIVGVQEKTIGFWIKKYAWKQERDAHFNSGKSQISQIKKLIGKLTDQRIELSRKMDEAILKEDYIKVEEIQQSANRLADEVSKYNKTLANLDKENRISLSVYLDVMEGVFKGIQIFNPKIYMSLLDFQDDHVVEMSEKLG
jgi:molecular chaperone DnaK (HSP70)